MNHILVIAAHPDDEIYGMGGTIAKLVSEGKKVSLLIVTDGSTAQYRDSKNLEQILQKKKQETANAAKQVGISAIYYGNLPDMRLDQTEHIAVNRVIENVIDEIRPDTVFTHFWGDVNLDHQCVYRSTLVAARPTAGQSVKELYCYRVPSSTEWQTTPHNAFIPNCFVDISAHTDQKTAAILAYETEIRAYPHPRSAQAVHALDTATGLRCGLGAAEEFILLRKVM